MRQGVAKITRKTYPPPNLRSKLFLRKWSKIWYHCCINSGHGLSVRPILGFVGVVMALELELKTYEANLDKWTDHAGKFVLIRGEEIVDFFAAYEDAIK